MHLDAQRAAALVRTEHRRPRTRPQLPEERGARVLDLLQPRLPHREHADLLRRAVPVLLSAEDAELLLPLAFQIEDGVHHVLEDARAGDRALLRDVTDEEDRDARL